MNPFASDLWRPAPSDLPIVELSYQPVLQLARSLLPGLNQLYLAPEIPHRKEVNARKVHAATLPAEEPLVLLYDDTVFGAADDGFVVTPVRLCWRNFTESPQSFRWGDVVGVTSDAKGLTVNDLRIGITIVSDGNAGKYERLFRILAASAQAAGVAPSGFGAPTATSCRFCGSPFGAPGPFCTQCGARRS
jgi:hypothetical protein